MEFASWREVDDSIELSILTLEVSDCLGEWFYREDCSSTSSVWTIIDSTRIAYCPVSEIMDKILKKPLFLGSFHDTGIEIWTQTFRKK